MDVFNCWFYLKTLRRSSMKEIYKKVADEMNIPISRVEKIHKAFWKEVKEHIASLPLKEDLDKEYFDSLHPCVNIPSLGKLYINFDKYKNMEKHFHSKKNKDATHKED